MVDEHATSSEVVARCLERAYARADQIDAEAARLIPLGQTISSTYPRMLQALASQIRTDINPVAIALISTEQDFIVPSFIRPVCSCPNENTRLGTCAIHGVGQ